MSNNNVDRFTRLVQAGRITRAEAQRRREQSRLARAAPTLVAPAVNRPRRPPGPVPEVRGGPSGYRRTEVWDVWRTFVEVGLISAPNTTSMCPSEMASIRDLDHILVEVYVEVLSDGFDPALVHCTVAGGLWRYVETVPDNEDDEPAAAIPTDIRRYAGSQDYVLIPGGPMVRWVFRPRQGDRVNSLESDMPALHLCLDPDTTILRPPSGEPTDDGRIPMSYRIGAVYWVRDRQGYLL